MLIESSIACGLVYGIERWIEKMDRETFRKYEYDLFNEDSMFIQYSNDPTHLLPPPGYEPRLVAESLHSNSFYRDDPVGMRDLGISENKTGENNLESEREPVEWEYEIASAYETELAARAYEKLFAHREFSLHGLKADVLEKTLDDWKLEISEERKIDALIDERLGREGGLDDFEPEMNWSGRSEGNAEDRAWRTLFGGREFRIEELRPEMQIQELARWRSEIVALNREDHQNHEFVDRVNEQSQLVERLEKALQLEHGDVDEPGAEIGQSLEEAETDFNKILFGDQSSFLLSGMEPPVVWKIRSDGWEDYAAAEEHSVEEHARERDDERDVERDVGRDDQRER